MRVISSIFLPLIFLCFIATRSHADLNDYVKGGCQSAVGWNIIQKISNGSYLVEYETIGTDPGCIRRSKIPGGCVASAILKTKSAFSSAGQIQGHLHVRKGGKMPFKKSDGFSKEYFIFEETPACETLKNKVDQQRAKKDPYYDCVKNNNPESCYIEGSKQIKGTLRMTGPWHNAMDLLKKACEKKHKKACAAIEEANQSPTVTFDENDESVESNDE